MQRCSALETLASFKKTAVAVGEPSVIEEPENIEFPIMTEDLGAEGV